MYTGNVYLDRMYLYFPSLLSEEDLLYAVKTRFPKLTYLCEMNREQLLDFYIQHIYPRPRRIYPGDSEGIAKGTPEGKEEEEGRQEEEDKARSHPSENPGSRLSILGRRPRPDSLISEFNKKVKLDENEDIKPSENDAEKCTETEESGADATQRDSQGVSLKRNPVKGDKRDETPAKKKRIEIRWP